MPDVDDNAARQDALGGVGGEHTCGGAERCEVIEAAASSAARSADAVQAKAVS